MVEITLYGDPQATCTQRVLILLEELGLKYKMEKVSLAQREQKSEEYMKLQPFGKVPALRYGERLLFESRAILRYVADRNSDIIDFFPNANVDVWLEAESQNYNPYASKIVAEKVFKKWRGEMTDERVIKEATTQLGHVLDVYEKQLEKHDYIAGNHFSIADISHIPYTHHLIKSGFKQMFKERPHVYAWLKRIMKREAVQRVLKTEN